MSYFDCARALLPISNCLKRKYSAVIVKDGEVIGSGVNSSIVECASCARELIKSNTGDYGECHSIHGEQEALLNSDRDKLHGSTLYLVCDKDKNPKPCPICQRMLDYCGVTQKVEGSDG